MVSGRDPPSLRSYDPSTARVETVDPLNKFHDEFLADVHERLIQAQQRNATQTLIWGQASRG